MEEDKQLGILESLLFAAGDEGLSIEQIGEAMEISEEKALQLLEILKKKYDEDPARGVTIVALAETYQLATKKEFSDYLKKLVETPSTSSLSQASLETLAIIAYKQPITRVEVEAIRGVKTERPLHTLVSKGLIKEVGRVEGTGRAKIYGTTSEFLDYFGLKDLQDLPELDETSNEHTSEEDEADLFFSSFKEQID
ncbi:SMC-Scp complex subunit ScpB [Lederbergia sp. NSJ-179]|uniref:SMC-Scp complex subunit ScpB n=1 Tax=Lederbergia sp. NSJ-179 TaxID=2931402 RepID=UPI001FD22CC8|nr:SMC-Scp complex subunit ScpB [Lederbergia sp. NSJ-179]MCJ7839416.1 SMC-Scp complex subunit ScpB [Lederbergia sp. NSJ-179]